MAKYSVKFVKGTGKVSATKVDPSHHMPSPLWVKKNKHTAEFEKIVRNSWSAYLDNFTMLLQSNYSQKASESLTRSKKTNDRYGQSAKYRRAANMEEYGSTRGHMATISALSGNPGFASGLYHDTMKAFLVFDGNNVEILHPMTDSKYKRVIKLSAETMSRTNIGNIGEQKGLMSLHLSKFLKAELGFNPRAWTTELAPFREGGIAYNFSLSQMNTKLAKLERSRKRGKYKKKGRKK